MIAISFLLLAYEKIKFSIQMNVLWNISKFKRLENKPPIESYIKLKANSNLSCVLVTTPTHLFKFNNTI